MNNYYLDAYGVEDLLHKFEKKQHLNYKIGWIQIGYVDSCLIGVKKIHGKFHAMYSFDLMCESFVKNHNCSLDFASEMVLKDLDYFYENIFDDKQTLPYVVAINRA